jgi:hypothetical protein
MYMRALVALFSEASEVSATLRGGAAGVSGIAAKRINGSLAWLPEIC